MIGGRGLHGGMDENWKLEKGNIRDTVLGESVPRNRSLSSRFRQIRGPRLGRLRSFCHLCGVVHGSILGSGRRG